jgi:hypothetical protein
MKKVIYSLLTFTFIAITACDNNNDISKVASDTTKKVKSGKEAIDKKTIKEFVDRIPSPMIISSIIKDSGIDYDQTLLNSVDNESKYVIEFKQALNLGVFSTDLGYANIYEKSQDAINLLVGVKDMADNLKIGQYFEFEKIKQLSKSKDKLDELLQLTEENLININNKLYEQDRSDLTVLIITGGWVEVMYLATQVVQKKPVKDLEQMIADQKIVLDQIVQLLDYYASQSKMRDLHDELVDLQKSFEKIKFTKSEGETKQEEKEGTVSVQQGGSEQAEMSKETLNEITTKIAAIRNKIVS